LCAWLTLLVACSTAETTTPGTDAVDALDSAPVDTAPIDAAPDTTPEDSFPDTHTPDAAPDIVTPADMGEPDIPTVPSCVENPVVVLEVLPLDIWAQFIESATITVGSGSQSISSEPGSAFAVALCDADTVSISVVAPYHEELHMSAVFDGTDLPGGLVLDPGEDHVAYAWTSEFKAVSGGQSVRHYRLWTGLPHHYFAPTGFPARHGTHVTLLDNGDEAWGMLAADMTLVQDHLLMTSWWWSSFMEIVRDPATHPWLNTEQRWENTIMGQLESLYGTQRKIMINQFLTQDGFFSQYNVDDALISKAETPGDNFEYMGIANPVAGAFWATPLAIDFVDRLQQALGDTSLDETLIDSAGLPPFSPPIWVDTTALPLGAGALQVPIASWHQKLVMLDGDVAYVGGMNAVETDWDRGTHRVYDALRMDFDASVSAREAVLLKEAYPDHAPAKDYMVRLEGPLASDVESVFTALWQFQLDQDVLYADLSTPVVPHPLPEPLADDPNVVQAQLLFTVPEPFGEYSVFESLSRSIARANQYIFIEDQYFRSTVLRAAIETRMQAVPGLRLIVVTNPISEWSDPGCWQTHLEYEALNQQFPTRVALFRLMSFDAVDTQCVLCIDEVLGTFMEHYLHSKLVLIDDVYVQVGSANHNNRSMLYDAELSVAVTDAKWARKTREQVSSRLLGSAHEDNMSVTQWWSTLKTTAAENQGVYELWSNVGFDLDQDGAPIPSSWIPRGFLYPLSFNPPSYCLIEGVGPDVM